MISSVAAATTAVAIVFTLIDFAVISFVVAMVWLTLKEKKEAEVQTVEVTEAPVAEAEPVTQAEPVVVAPVAAEPVAVAPVTQVVVITQPAAQAVAVPVVEETPKAEAAVTELPVRLTFDEAYEQLSKAQKSFLNGLLDYAKSKDGTRETRTKNNVSVKKGNSLIIRLSIKREITFASFNIENDSLKSYRRDVAREKGARINVKATDVPVYDVDGYDVAKGLIDVAYEECIGN